MAKASEEGLGPKWAVVPLLMIDDDVRERHSIRTYTEKHKIA